MRTSQSPKIGTVFTALATEPRADPGVDARASEISSPLAPSYPGRAGGHGDTGALFLFPLLPIGSRGK